MVALKALQAAEEGNLTALQRFDSSVLSEKTVDESGSNCLHYAARQGGVEVLKFLVSDKGFKGNTRSDVGATPAHDAAAAGNLQSLQWLLQNTSCDVNDQDGIGATVLHLACRYHHTHVTEWLLEQGGCDVNKTTASGGLPLHFAVVGKDYDAVKLLLSEDPMSVNIQIGNGATACYLAAQEGRADILRTLIQDHRGNIKIKSYDGMSCLHAAAQSGHIDCVQILVEEEKHNPNERDFDGATPLHYAASQGHAHVIDWLMKVGGARVTLDNLGGSPLHNAAEMNSVKCVCTLINNGCDTSITDNNGLTAAELARKCFHDDCATLIETYTAQSQIPLEPDVEYLLSAQSPRVNLLRPYVTQFDGRQPPNTPSFLTREQDSPFETGNPPVTNGQSKPPAFVLYSQQGINQTEGEPSLKPKSRAQSAASLVVEADPAEFPVGIPRSVSKDFSVDTQLDGNQFENSPLSSSLSSLSQPDEVIEKASKEIEKEELSKIPSEQIGKLNQPQFLLERPGTSAEIKPHVNGSQFVKPSITKTKNSVFTGFSYLKSNTSEPKSVNITADGNRYENRWLKDRTGRDNMATEDIQKDNQGKMNGDEVLDEGDQLVENGTVDSSESGINGSVQTAHIVTPTDTNKHASAPLVNNHGAIGTKSILKLELSPPDSNQPLVNGNISPSHPYNGESTPISHPSQPDIKKPSFSSNRSILKDDSEVKPNGLNSEDLGGVENQIGKPANGMAPLPVNQPETQPLGLQAPPPPPPPPPPPAPPLPTLNTQLELNGDVKPKNDPLSPEAVIEAKKKSVSLPARPTALFTAEMMQSKRSTLSPAPAKTMNNSSQSGNTDFISELKLATKGPALRKTSKVGDTGGKPMMIFSSNSKQSPAEVPKEDKDTKAELTGEWDPKKFVDMVPNKDGLPAWKVQLQAKQIAEKTMKETLEKRKVEERENRFKNMPAWKRALVEKKEAEARAAEEKRQEEQQQKAKLSAKKTLNISVTPKAKDSNSGLAPWQLELQNKD